MVGVEGLRAQSRSEPEPEPPSGFPHLFSHNTGAWTIHSGQGLLPQAEKCALLTPLQHSGGYNPRLCE